MFPTCSKQLFWQQESHLSIEVIHKSKQTTRLPLYFLHASYSLCCLIPTALAWEIILRQSTAECPVIHLHGPKPQSFTSPPASHFTAPRWPLHADAVTADMRPAAAAKLPKKTQTTTALRCVGLQQARNSLTLQLHNTNASRANFLKENLEVNAHYFKNYHHHYLPSTMIMVCALQGWTYPLLALQSP